MRLVGLGMVSMGLHPIVLRQNMSSTKQQIDLSDELKLVNIWGCSADLHYTQGIEQVLDHLILLFSNNNAFRAFEGRSRAISSQFVPKLSLTETPAQPSNLPKLTPCAMIFWLSDDSKDVQYILAFYYC